MRYLIAALRHPQDYRWFALRPFRRHSLVLVVAGSMYIAIGVSILTSTPTCRAAALRVPLTWAPPVVWSTMFIVVGILAVLSSRWPPASEKWGYSVLSGLSALWATFYAWGLFSLGSAALPGLEVWSLVTFLWWAIAGLVNAHELPIHDEREV